jgi:MSHA biogenesis protein MshQ
LRIKFFVRTNRKSWAELASWFKGFRQMDATGCNSFGVGEEGGHTYATGRAMNRLAKVFVLFVSLMGLGAWGGDANALVCITGASGNWNANIWTGVGSTCAATGPIAGDTVTIANGHTVTITANAAAASLTVNAGGIVNSAFRITLSTTATIAGAVNLTAAAARIRVTGVTNVTGTLNLGPSTGGNRFTGLVTLNPGAVWTATTATVNFRGGLTNNATTFTAGSGAYTVTTANQAFGGTTTIVIPSLAITTVTLTNNAALTVTTLSGSGSITNNATLSVLTTMSGTGTYTNATAGIMNIAAATVTPTLTATAAGNTVNYNGAAAQTVKPTTYNNLTLSGAGVKTTATVTVSGILSMEGTATASAAPTYGAAATLQYNTATARTAGVEWSTPFAGTGGVVIANTGAITMNAAKVFNASVPLTINSGATLNTNNLQLTLGGNFVNSGTFNAGSSPIVITSTMATQSIDGFSTTGLVSMTKTAGTATFTGNVNGAGLTLNGAGGTLNLGAGLTHTFTGAWTRTNGTLNGGSSTLNIGGSCSGAGGTFTAGTGTVNWNAAGAQTVCPVAYNNLSLSNSGAKTMTGVTAIAGDLSITGAATMASDAAFTAGGALNYSSTGATTLVAPIVIGSFNQTAGTFSAGANAITVSGNWNETGTFNPGTGTVTLNGATAQTISGTSPVNFNNLTVTNAASPNITLATNVTVTTLTGTVTLTSSCPDFTLTSTTPAQTLHSCSAVVNTITRLDSSPTSASTVRWAVNFSNSVTGVATTNFALVESGVSGTSIVSVSGSGTSWTVTANTGVGAGSLGLNMTSSAGVSPAPTNLPFTGEVYTITVPTAVADYRMDEGSWNGTANEVKDSSVSALHGTAMLGAVPATGKICNAGNFTANYVNVADNPALDITNNLTVSVWIKPTRCGGAPGKDALMSFYSKDDNYEAHVTSTCKINWWWGTGNITSVETVPTNAWTHVAMVYVAGNQTLYINGVADATGTVAGVLPTNSLPLQIANDQEFGGGTRRFDGMIDELKIFNSALSAAKIFAGYTNENAGTNWDGTARVCPVYGPDHLEIQHSSGTGLTCAASTLTIKACTDSAVPCVTPYTGGISGTLSASGTPTVNWDGTTGGAAGAGFVIPNGSSTVSKDVQVTPTGTVIFGVASATPSPTNSAKCNFGTNSPTNNNCVFTSSAAGFIFSDTTAPGDPYTIPSQVSGIATPTLYLRAVQAAATNPAVCTPAIINQSINVDMGYVCVDPGTCQPGNLATINATAIAPGGTAVPLSFDANGSAPITVRYDDAGHITLTATKTLTPFGGATAVTLNDSGNASFVVAPDHFGFSSITTAPIQAGSTFNATVTALNNAGSATKNFLGQTVTITSSNPQPGIGNATAINYALSGFSNGEAIAALSWKEVGKIDLSADISNYLSSGLSVSGTQLDVGRFQPAYFDTAVTSACNTFSYAGSTIPAKAGQPFTVTVTAKEVGGGITKNYDGVAYAYDATLSNAGDSTGLAGNSIVASSFANGVGSANVTYAVAVPETVPLTLTMRATDADLPPVTSSGHTEGTVDMRSGRAKIGNAHGSELLSLPIPFRTEYWSSNGWVTNSADTCSGDGALGGGVSVALSAVPVTCVQDTGSPGRSNAGCAATGPTGLRFKEGGVPGFAGDFNLWLKATGAGNTGAVTVTGNVPTWLQYAWDGGAVTNPTGLATFGVFKGNNEFIYLRESY